MGPPGTTFVIITLLMMLLRALQQTKRPEVGLNGACC
jgi:hypothetical protein